METGLAPGDEFAGYRIEALLARGGMALLYRARHIRLDRVVALKLIAPDYAGDERFQRRFVKESEIAASLEHPHIIPVYAADRLGESLYIAMRFVDGPDLRRLLEAEGPLPLDRAVFLFRQAASALDAAHQHGLVHRDVKPANVLVDPRAGSNGREHLYLTDFGLTRRSSGTEVTDTGHFLGTIDYVAPEQISGAPLDGRADVYALGCMLFRALTGEAPFRAESDAAVLYAHLSKPPPRVTATRGDLPAAVDAVLATALAKRPADRYDTCLAMLAELRAAQESPSRGGTKAPGLRPQPTLPPRPVVPAAGAARRGPAAVPAAAPPPPAPRRRPWLYGGAALAACLAVLLAVVLPRVLPGSRPATEAARAVLLPFAPERYTGGVTVTRTWTLRGAHGESLHAVLRVVGAGKGRQVFYEVLPPGLPTSLTAVRFVPPPQRRLAAEGAVGYSISVSRTPTVLAYDVPVPPGPLALSRLAGWAQQWSQAAGAFSARHPTVAPLRVRSLSVLPSRCLQLAPGGVEHRLTLTATDSRGHAVRPGDLTAAVFSSDEPRVATVDPGGLVAPHTTGRATITAVLGGLRDSRLVVVSAGQGCG